VGTILNAPLLPARHGVCIVLRPFSDGLAHHQVIRHLSILPLDSCEKIFESTDIYLCLAKFQDFCWLHPICSCYILWLARLYATTIEVLDTIYYDPAASRLNNFDVTSKAVQPSSTYGDVHVDNAVISPMRNVVDLPSQEHWTHRLCHAIAEIIDVELDSRLRHIVVVGGGITWPRGFERTASSRLTNLRFARLCAAARPQPGRVPSLLLRH